MLRQFLLSMSRNDEVRNLVVAAPVTKNVVERFIPGESIAHVVSASERLLSNNLTVTIDRLGEDVVEIEQAQQTVADYLDLLSAIEEQGWNSRAEVSLKLSALGQALGESGPQIATENAYKICEAARAAGTTVTLDMEDHTTTDLTLETLFALRKDFPFVGAVLQAYLYRTEADCRALAYEGSRVRLCKGAYKEPESVAYPNKIDVDLSYVRCARILLEGAGYPMYATHDPTIIEIIKSLVAQGGRAQDSFEFQMLYGVRPEEQKSLADAGFTSRIYVPYGQDWYGYFMRRLAERPANLAFFARSLLTKD